MTDKIKPFSSVMSEVSIKFFVAFLVTLFIVPNCGGTFCCSQWGACGDTPEFCDPDQGCQEGYGYCGLPDDNTDNDPQVVYTCHNMNTIALTFDDGPRPWTNDLLDTLDEANIKATFFINGHNEDV
ncbi:6723_t:CDS:2, partial [Dentiscutata heterogama]